MSSAYSIEKFEGNSISDEMAKAAAEIFSSNYGVWGSEAQKEMGPFAKQGARVKMSVKKLKDQILPSDAKNVYVRMMVGNKLAGNVFATRWVYDGRPMVWITQLCVSRSYRNQGIAKRLLEALDENEGCFGILSSHPFAISAVLRVFGRGVGDVDLKITKDNARALMSSCPVEYVRKAKLHGTLFEKDVQDGSVSCADTQFWVDHTEPLEALATIKKKGIVWPLGELPDGHEFLVLVKAQKTESS